MMKTLSAALLCTLISTVASAQAFECATASSPESLRAVPEYQRVGEPSTAMARIDVLVLYSEADHLDWIVDTTFRGAAKMFRDSHTNIDLRLVGVMAMPGDVGIAVAALANSTEPTWRQHGSSLIRAMRASDEVDDLRGRVGADLVVAFAPQPDFAAVGMAYQPSALDRSLGFSFVATNGGVSHLLAHELGHNLGLAHQDGPDAPIYRYGRAYIGEGVLNGHSVSTIMANPARTFRLGTFSRNGHYRMDCLPKPCTGRLVRVGDADTRAADAAREVGHIIAAYQDAPLDPHTLTLHNRRFEVSVSFYDDGWSDAGVVPVDLPGESSGLFSFFDHANAEMLVKVLNGCAYNSHWWVFAAAATDLGFEIRVLDTRTGAERTYTNESGTAPPALTNIDAFQCEP